MIGPDELRDLAEELDELVRRRDEPEEGDEPLDDGDRERMKALDALAHDLGGDLHVAANHGVTLIEEGREFREHARGLAVDCLNLDEAQWPMTCIDWEQAADELATDYSSVSFDGTDYLTNDL